MKKFMAVFAVVAIVAFAAPALAATNPFMDVPAGHWAYDAVAQLASRGIASGYPDGSYKGTQPATRYEMASMVARALAQVDMEKASKQDVELLKRLVLEFKNELDALGVKVNDLDKRVAVLEDGIGGWKIRGIFQFDAKFGSSDNDDYRHNGSEQRNEFTKERFRLFLTKTIDENTYFYAQYRTGANGGGDAAEGRGDTKSSRWSHLYVDTKLPYDIGLRVGRFDVDFEGGLGLYIDNDALFGDFRADGFMASKSWGMLTATAAVARNFNAVGHEFIDYQEDFLTSLKLPTNLYTEDHMAYILDLNFQPNEKFFIGATGYWGNGDSDGVDWDSNTYGFYAGYSFTPAIQLKGIYYFQDNDFGPVYKLLPASYASYKFEDSPKAWKAILDIGQDALKFTSLWVEYSQVDNTFLSNAYPRYSIGNTDAHMMVNRQVDNDKTKILFVKATQKWTDKWSTWLRYGQADFGTTWDGFEVDDAKEYGIGVGYQYTPAIKFELAYDFVDYGTTNWTHGIAGVDDPRNGDESVVRFRTSVSF